MSTLPKRGETRQQLIGLLRGAESGQIQSIEELLRTKRDGHRQLIHLLTQLEFSEADARSYWIGILAHRHALSKKLDRPASLQLAVLDYFQTQQPELDNPKIVEMATFLATERHAITDGLTELHNRQFFDVSLRRELKRSRRYGLAFSVVMLDLDNFKSVNDAHGHLIGDGALVVCAGIIRESVREIDVACRYGGEEFAIILPETSRTGAYIVSERIRADIQEHFARHRVADTVITLSISGGVALYPTDSNSAQGLMRMADRALYRSKHEGKNKITLHADEKRRSPRFDARKLLVFRERRDGGPEERHSETMNLSRNGALVGSREPINVGTELEIALTIPQSSSSFSLRGRVVRLEEAPSQGEDAARYHVGVAFVSDTDEDVRQIENLAIELYRPFEESHEQDQLG